MELLLDTICNTFGGVLFLAILIAVLLQFRGSAHPIDFDADEHARLAELRHALDEARKQLAALQRDVVQQRRLLEDWQDPQFESLLLEVERLQQLRDQLQREKLESLSRTAGNQQRANELLEQIDRRASELERAEERAKVLNEILQSELASRSEAARMPVLRPTDKQEAVVAVRHGKLYLLGTPSESNLAGSNDFELVREGPRIGVRTRPGAGTAIDEGEVSRSLITQRVTTFDPRHQYIAVFVWPDSFGAFRELKSVLLQHQFEYRLVPLSADTEILWSGGTGDVEVQR